MKRVEKAVDAEQKGWKGMDVASGHEVMGGDGRHIGQHLETAVCFAHEPLVFTLIVGHLYPGSLLTSQHWNRSGNQKRAE